jgi:integrase
MARRRGHHEGSITEIKDKNGKVVAFRPQLSLSDGTRKSFPREKTRTAAQRSLDDAKAAALQGRLVTSRTQTMGKYLAGWLETIRHGVRPRTLEVYDLNVRRMLPHLRGIRLDMLTPTHIQDCYNALLTDGLSKRTVQQTHMVLHKALSDAVKMRLVVWNASDGTTPPVPLQREMATLTGLQLNKLFDATTADRFHALWVLLSVEGLRVGEALGLKWTDVDFSSRTLKIKRALQRQQGAGLVFVEPKTARGRRDIQISDSTCVALQAHGERQVFERKGAREAWQEHDLIFCTAFGTPLDRGRIHLNWRAALQHAGLPIVRVHDLRHTAATLMREEGVNIEVVQRRLGHSSISVTLDVYGHVGEVRQRDAAERMDAMLARNKL